MQIYRNLARLMSTIVQYMQAFCATSACLFSPFIKGHLPPCNFHLMNNSRTNYISALLKEKARQETFIISPRFQSSDFGEEDKLLLFGSTDSDVAFEQFDTDGDGEVNMHFK